METTEKIVESYCRYIKQRFTIPNIRCKGQYEVDLLAVDTTSPKSLHRYHVECGVSISGSYSIDKPFSTEDLKIRVKQAGQRRTIGYFIHRKFGLPEVVAELRNYGFTPVNYERIIVTWGATARRKLSPRSTGSIYGIFETCFARLPPPARSNELISRMIQLGRFSFCYGCR